MKISKFFISLVMLLLLSCKLVFYERYTDESKPIDTICSKRFNLQTYDGYSRIQKSENLLYNGIKYDSLRTEFQFLYISKNSDSVIFITTIPSKYWYDKSGINLIDDETPNSYYFHHFYFGKMNVDSRRNIENIEFTARKLNAKMKWYIQENQDTIRLLNIDTYRSKKMGNDTKKDFFTNNFSINSNFGRNKKVIYKKINDTTTIGYAKFPDSVSQNTVRMKTANEKFYAKYLQVNCKNKKIKNIEFIFNRPFDIENKKEKFRKNNTIRFKKNRTLFVRQKKNIVQKK